MGLWTRLIHETLLGFQVIVTPGEAFEKARRMISDRTFLNISGVAIALARETGVDRDQEVRARFLSLLDKVMDLDGPSEQLLTVLNELRGMDVKLGIVSFMLRPRLVNRLQVWKLDTYFGPLITPEDFSEFKPSPVPFLAAITRLGVDASRCFVVGDEPADIEGGRKAGARCVGVPRGFFTKEELVEAGAETTIESLTDLPKIVADP